MLLCGALAEHVVTRGGTVVCVCTGTDVCEMIAGGGTSALEGALGGLGGEAGGWVGKQVGN